MLIVLQLIRRGWVHRIILCVVIFSKSVLATGLSGSAPEILNHEYWGIQLENDVLAKTDRYYTHGTQVSRTVMGESLQWLAINVSFSI